MPLKASFTIRPFSLWHHLPFILSVLQSSGARWPRSTNKWSKRTTCPRRPTDMEGSLGWKKTEWTRFDKKNLILKHDKQLIVLTRIFSTCRWRWAMTMWQKLSSTLPRRMLLKVLEGNLVFRKTVSTRWEEHTPQPFVWSSKKIHLWQRLTCFWKRPPVAIRRTASSV